MKKIRLFIPIALFLIITFGFFVIAATIEITNWPERLGGEKPVITKINGQSPDSKPEIVIKDGSLRVQFSYAEGDDFATLEIWALIDSEKQVFEAGNFVKDDNRPKQFLLVQNYRSDNTVTLAGATDKKTGNETSKKPAWGGDLKIESFYNYIKGLADASQRKFYVVIESDKKTDGTLEQDWKDSSLKEINFLLEKEGPPPPPPTEEEIEWDTWEIWGPAEPVGECTSIVECLARIDKKLVEGVFE